MQKETFLGSVSLKGLTGAYVASNDQGRKAIIIPLDPNPCIYYQQKQDGTEVINLDIEVKPTPENKFKNAFMIKANVGKQNRERFGIQKDQMDQYTPILGNLKRFTYETKEPQGQGQGNYGPQPQGGYQQGGPAPQGGYQQQGGGYQQGGPQPQGGYPQQGGPAPQGGGMPPQYGSGW